jgi:hypothetical protein
MITCDYGQSYMVNGWSRYWITIDRTGVAHHHIAAMFPH